MNRRWQLWIAVLGILCFGVFVQAGTVCHVVDCSLPQTPACPHHEPEAHKLKVCDEIAAVIADLEEDVQLPESPIGEFAFRFFDSVTNAPSLCAVASGTSSAVLRL